jgi:hypothetical protein
MRVVGQKRIADFQTDVKQILLFLKQFYLQQILLIFNASSEFDKWIQ